MADNVAVTAGIGTSIATDDVSGVQYQVVKIDVGGDGVASGPVSVSNPLPVTAVLTGPAITSLQLIDDLVLAEDAVHGSGDKGVMALSVRKDSAASLSGTDGDYTPLQVTATGALRVAITEDTVGSILDVDSVAKVTLNSKYIANGATDCVPKYAVISCASSGANTIVASVSSKKIRVLAYNFIANGTVSAKFQSGAGGTNLTGLKYCVANMGICAPFNPAGWFETAATTLLSLDLSNAIAVGGELVYIEV